MEIHKPKPIHGWREFLSEMTVIVLGILIALGAEQLIESLHWRHEVNETELRLTRELGGNVSAAIGRLRTASCLERRLDEIASVIDAAERSGKLLPLGDLRHPSIYLWGHGTWDSAVASQVTTHFPARRLANYSVAYGLVTRLGELNQRELETWADLWMIVGPGRPYDGSAAEGARLALSHARILGREMGLASQGLLDRVKALDLPVTDTSYGATIASILHAPQSAFEVCRPIGTEISPRYGQTPLDEVPAQLQKSLSDPQHLF